MRKEKKKKVKENKTRSASKFPIRLRLTERVGATPSCCQHGQVRLKAASTRTASISLDYAPSGNPQQHDLGSGFCRIVRKCLFRLQIHLGCDPVGAMISWHIRYEREAATVVCTYIHVRSVHSIIPTLQGHVSRFIACFRDAGLSEHKKHELLQCCRGYSRHLVNAFQPGSKCALSNGHTQKSRDSSSGVKSASFQAIAEQSSRAGRGLEDIVDPRGRRFSMSPYTRIRMYIPHAFCPEQGCFIPCLDSSTQPGNK